MLKAGLTGSIAVGKSYVLACFRELGCHVLDADKTARDVVEPGTVGLGQLVREFGADILFPDGTLDRKKLGAIVFANEEKRKVLNSIVHPLVFERQDQWIKESEKAEPAAIAIVDAALMIESGGYKRFDKLIVVWCEPALQLERLMLRDNLDETDAVKRINAQMTQEEKKTYADYLIDTSGSFQYTRHQVEKVFAQLEANSA